MEKKVFISYSDADKNKVQLVANKLKGTNIFVPIIVADKRQALVSLTDKVKSGIIDCDYFLPILTRKSIHTQWINQEIGFASALKRKIVPIIERQIAKKLKGFIHKQVDLPYSFDGNTKNKWSEATKFSRIVTILINDLLIENNINPKEVSIENLFPGKWESTININDRKIHLRGIEIKEKNKYFEEGKYAFNIEEIKFDIKNKRLSFIKKGIGKDDTLISNNLNIVELGKRYEGIENNNKIGDNISITYSKVSD